MELPKLVYHGTFWPEGTELGSEGLKTKYGYVSTTPDQEWARYFAMCTRWNHRELPGEFVVYEINTGKLPEEVREKSIPPDGFHPRSVDIDLIRKIETSMKEERIKVGDWRFLYIPIEAIVSSEEEHRDAAPTLDLITVGLYYPR